MFHLPKILTGPRELLFRVVIIEVALAPIIDLLKHPAGTDKVRSSDN